MSDRRHIPRLMLVTDRRTAVWPLPELARRAVAGGVDAVHVREKDLDEATLQALVEQVVNAVGDDAAVVVNGNIAVAARLGIGLHLPEHGPTIAEARAALGMRALIGRSVHDPGTASRSQGASYLIAGHVYPTLSKAGLPALGLDGLQKIVQAAPCPVLAIGGITAENAAQALATGAHGIAVLSAINCAADPEQATRRIYRLIEKTQEASMTTTEAAVRVTINGNNVELSPGTTIQDFLASKGYHERLVVVEVNESIVPRAEYSSVIFKPGDRVEIVHFVGGG